jgi:hypothetical protein
MFQYFRAASDSVYERVRAAIDAACGYPSADGLTVTAMDSAAQVSHDKSSRPHFQLRAEFCDQAAVADPLQQMISSGSVEEISEFDFWTVAAETGV